MKRVAALNIFNHAIYSIRKHFHKNFGVTQVGGFAEVYKGGLTLATVREAGHQVPSYQPARALTLIKYFLDGTPLPGPPKRHT